MIRTRSDSSAAAVEARPSSAASKRRVDIITGTLGKALGGASGGFTSRTQARSSRCSGNVRVRTCSRTRWRRRSRRRRCACWNCWRGDEGRGAAPIACGATVMRFRAAMTASGFDLVPGAHPIIPVMLGDAALAGADGRRAAGGRGLRDRLFLPGRAEGQGAHPHPDERGADDRSTLRSQLRRGDEALARSRRSNGGSSPSSIRDRA